MGIETLPGHEEARPAGGCDPYRLLCAGAIGAGAVAALLVLSTVITRHLFAFDRSIMFAIHGAGPAWVRQAMIAIKSLGSTTVLTLAVAASAGLVAVHGLWLTAALIAAATVTGSGMVQVLKGLFARTRPDIVDHLVTIGGASFSSGHSTNSAIVYLTLAGLLTQVVRRHAPRRYVLGAALALVAMIGVSRVYLGVHWPSNVLAGWSFGTLWAAGWWMAGARARAPLLSSNAQG